MDVKQLGTDSGDYEYLRSGVQLAPSGYYMACEIGVREGGSSQMIMEELAAKRFPGLMVMVDHYGGMPQWHSDNQCLVLDYTNEMRNRAMSALYELANHYKVNFQFFNLTDEDFFTHFADGVPVYAGSVRMMSTEYCFVHLDGPHHTELLEKEVDFFAPRMVKGGVIVVDDIALCTFSRLQTHLEAAGFALHSNGTIKAVFVKQ